MKKGKIKKLRKLFQEQIDNITKLDSIKWELERIDDEMWSILDEEFGIDLVEPLFKQK